MEKYRGTPLCFVALATANHYAAEAGTLGGGARGRKQDINCLMSVRKRVSGAYCEAMRARGTKTPARKDGLCSSAE